jgi:D-beta-D-heptose 7-phosphate kinase/D-beta-D-heptose 1-phosphate adenosyltransferase
MPDKKPVFFVLGDLMLDHYIMGESTRISPEAPVPVVTVKEEKYSLGGALNVVNNLVSLGGEVMVGGLIGDDEAGGRILHQLNVLGVHTQAVYAEKDRVTTQKSRIMASNQQIMRYDLEKIQAPQPHSMESILQFLTSQIHLIDCILLSDYNKGVLTPALCQQVIKIANEYGKKVLVDPKGKDYHKYNSAYLITPNKKETTEITGIDIDSEASLLLAGQQLKQQMNLTKVIMTLGSKGMALYDEELHVYPTVAREVYDVTGAGDTVLAALAVGLAVDMEIGEACGFANAAAAVVVGKLGSATATRLEIADFLAASETGQTHKKIVSLDEIIQVTNRAKNQDKKIIFTNGCFDVLHAGHVSYLQKAKSLGDVLIVGLNSNDSVTRLKGAGRPVNDEKDRALVLAGLASVDYVVVFNQDTPYELIQSIQPDVLTKGADYKDKEVVGSDVAKEVVSIDFVDGKSTTSIIDKLKALE